MEWNRDTPWRQGHLLCQATIEALKLHTKAHEQTLAMVVSHDCDLAQTPDREPFIEIVLGHLVAEGEGNYTHAKNLRKLHVEFSGAAECWVEFDAITKISIDKLALNDVTPRTDAYLSPENQTILQMWLASRYRRSAFPNEFERRLTLKGVKLHEKITKAVKPHGALIAGIFFDVDEGVENARRGPDDLYILDITVLHTADPDFDAAEKAALKVAQEIEAAFKDKLFNPTNTWQHIELRFCEAISESVLTYQQFKQLKRWQLEHISLAAEPQQAVLAQ